MIEEPDRDTRNVCDLSSGRIIRKQTRPARVWAPKKPKHDDREDVTATRSVRDDSANTDSISEAQQEVTDDRSEPIPESGNHDHVPDSEYIDARPKSVTENEPAHEIMVLIA